MLSYRKSLVSPLVIVLLAASLAACSKQDGPQDALERFLTGWAKGDVAEVPVILPNGEKVGAQAINEEIKTLSGSLFDAKPQLSVAKVDEPREGLATGKVTVKQPVPGGLTWEYQTTVKLSKDKDGWQVIWEPSVIHPKVTRGDHLDTRVIEPSRGSVLGGDGNALVESRPVVVVGIWPAQREGSKEDLVTELKAALAPIYRLQDTEGLVKTISDPGNADQFIEVITLRREDYDKVRPQLRAIDGVFFRERQMMLAETRDFAAPLLGRVGPVTKEIMDANPGVYQTTDLVGQGGLQERYDQRLRGTPGVKIVSARKAPDGTTQETVLHTIEPNAGPPVKTTLDTKTQRAAEAALAKFPQSSALVAIRISDGAVLAAANQATYNMAFTAQVPPGSTFKAVTAFGLLDRGLVTADQPVPCPQVLNVTGRPPIHNAGMFSIPGATFREDFYRSCNTAFAALAPKLGGEGLVNAGATLGLGKPWDLGIEASSGKVSQGGSPGELAAAAFGQGTTVVSPVAMAAVAAAIARGQWKQPVLVLDPAPAKPAPDGPALKASTVEPLREMMRLVVTKGTASSLDHHRALSGKTGTAEYVTGDPSKTHAWFIGWSGDIAFAVFVEQGGSPSQTALPITDAFLKQL